MTSPPLPPCYVISLTSAQKRRAHTSAEFGRVGLPFEFFDAVTPAQLDAACARLGVTLAPQPLTPGELACFFSHLSVWQTAFAADANLPCIAVFEDDMLLSPHSRALLEWAASTQGVEAFDVLKLETFLTPLRHREPFIDLAAGFHAFTLRDSHWGAGGYVITRKAAEYFIDRSRALAAHTGQLPPVDVLMFADIALPEHRVLQVTPAMCVQERFWMPQQNQGSQLGSDLETERVANARSVLKRKRPLGEKLWAELTNPFRKLWRKYTMRPVPFDTR